ncbi:MAG TPA: SWIM zinc finger family protein, partial [Xanthomonadales bacterium]|nr:SWIM zinc finger family protein [Xanthomonadales bacterium]
MPVDLQALIARHFASAYAKGLGYFEQRRVKLLAFDEHKATGEVRGSRPRPYHAQVRLHDQPGREPGLSGQCTCPVGVGCKHIVALALAWQAKLAEAGASAPPGLQADPDPWAKWASQQRAAVERRPGDERIVYCCRYQDGNLYVRPVVARRGKDGWSAGRAIDLFSSRLDDRLSGRPQADRLLVAALARAD